ncbi:MAG: hypothetical protein U0984_13870 [Prosthecobacter sp.]|nr:hypothetical protein [Prosthecobacter sp.]
MRIFPQSLVVLPLKLRGEEKVVALGNRLPRHLGDQGGCNLVAVELWAGLAHTGILTGLACRRNGDLLGWLAMPLPQRLATLKATAQRVLASTWPKIKRLSKNPLIAIPYTAIGFLLSGTCLQLFLDSDQYASLAALKPVDKIVAFVGLSLRQKATVPVWALMLGAVSLVYLIYYRLRRSAATQLITEELEEESPPLPLSEDDLKVLRHVAKEGGSIYSNRHSFSEHLHMPQERLIYHLVRLQKSNLIQVTMHAVEGSRSKRHEVIALTQKGREESVRLGFL